MLGLIKSIFQQVKKYKFFDTFKHTSTYFSGKMVVQALALISMPVYTYFLDEAEFGVISVFGSLVSMMTILLTMNLNGSIGRYYFEEREDWKEFNGTSMIAALAAFLVFGATFYYFKDWIAYKSNLPKQTMIWVLFTVFGTSVWRTFEMFFIARKESKTYATNEIIYHYSKFGLALVGILFMTSDRSTGKIMGEGIAASLIALYLLYKLLPYVKLHFSWTHLKYICHFTLPLIPYILSGQILNYFDQFYIISTVSQASAGLYSFAYKVGMLLQMLLVALLAAAGPDFYKWMNAKEYGELRGQVISIMKLLTLGASFLIFFAVDVGDLLASKDGYNEALYLVPIIVVGYSFFGIAQLYNRFIFYSKKNIWLAMIMIIAGILNIYLNMYFVPFYGFGAAAYTTLASYAFMMSLSWVVNKFILKNPDLPLLHMLKYIVLLFLLLPIYYYLIDLEMNYILNILLRLTVFGIVAVIIFWSKLSTLKLR